MINTNGAGVAICSCGAELEIRCTGGCAVPDAVFKNAIATMRKPPGPRHVAPPRKPRLEFCNFEGCLDRVVPYSGKGQPPKRCAAHKTKRYNRNGTGPHE